MRFEKTFVMPKLGGDQYIYTEEFKSVSVDWVLFGSQPCALNEEATCKSLRSYMFFLCVKKVD